MNKNLEYIGKGIGTLGIWGAVGWIGTSSDMGTAVVGVLALFAMISMIFVWGS